MSEGIRARLFDADGHDRAIELAEEDLASIGERRLLWVDVDLDAGGTLDDVAGPLDLEDLDRRRLEADIGHARLVQGVERLHVTLEAMEVDASDGADGRLVRREIDLIAGPGLVLSVHRGRIDALERFMDELEGETSLGVLDAADLLSSLIDEVINGYYRLAETIEQQIDDLDHAALRGDRAVDVLASLVAIRQRISLLRRTLAPHRSALAALARPETDTEQGVGKPWPGLVERLEAALGTIESLRDSLLGTYDIHLGRERSARTRS